MSLVAADGGMRHFPADPSKFIFDKEVSAIFPDMAKRSIPNFYEAHQAHAAMLKERLVARECRILDIGASRGAFFDAVLEETKNNVTNIEFTAVDNSPEMCEFLQDGFPQAKVHCLDIAGDIKPISHLYDIVCMHYVLQFIPTEHQITTLLRVFSLIRPGGYFVFGHKAMHKLTLGSEAHEQYIRFRLKNGYTREEIEAKTKALKGSMFTMDHDRLMNTLRLHFTEVQETFRFMMFSTLIARK